MRIALDAMGGDHGPAEAVAGALQARAFLDDQDVLVLVGDEAVVRQHLGEQIDEPCFELHHAPQAIAMDEPPVQGLRSKPESSIAEMTRLQKRGQVEACISAGNTGACVAAAQMGLSRLPGVHRPGISVLVPTFHGPVALCDVGANVNCRPKHLHQYAVMTSLYYQAVTGKDNPRVGLLSVGEEETKGNPLVKKASELLKNDNHVNFIGNVQGSDLLRDIFEVMVCEGFVGNVVLKLVEGLGRGLVKGLVEQFQSIMPDRMDQVLTAARKIDHMYDFNQYGGAPLLGVDGIWIICHGASRAQGIAHAVRSAKDFAQQRVNERITEFLAS